MSFNPGRRLKRKVLKNILTEEKYERLLQQAREHLDEEAKKADAE